MPSSQSPKKAEHLFSAPYKYALESTPSSTTPGETPCPFWTSPTGNSRPTKREMLSGIKQLQIISKDKYPVPLITGSLRQDFFLYKHLHKIICRFRRKSGECLYITDVYDRLAEQVMEKVKRLP